MMHQQPGTATSPLYGYGSQPISGMMPVSSVAHSTVNNPPLHSYQAFAPATTTYQGAAVPPAPQVHVPTTSKVHSTGQGVFNPQKSPLSFTTVTYPKYTENQVEAAQYKSYIQKKQHRERPVEKRLHQRKAGCCHKVNSCCCGAFDRLACGGCFNCDGCCDRPTMEPCVNYDTRKYRKGCC
ncbi:MAG: hypothetical protein KVP17_000889 [Porospora cf. gigantea B]|uniref:uncharacterized protein n=2 Tax=Porospora cf. gigantea B TaxID=2853592 RepID=UPI0035719DDA|nr:MAG: hypothetical protein KVP17_000889 [Porospora cf. gigantea B]